jgi:exopolysaccharide production protein ExoQ
MPCEGIDATKVVNVFRSKAATMAGGLIHSHAPSRTQVPASTILKMKFLDSPEQPSGFQRISRLAAVFAVVVQQGAFVSSPVLTKFVSDIGSSDSQASNILNTLAVFLNIVCIAPLCLLQYRQVIRTVNGNRVAIALMVLMFLSTTWSIHPDVTFRRDVTYFSTVLTAFYLATRFDVDEIMKIVSYGIAISVVFSFLFVAAFPTDAIHQPSPWPVEGINDIAGSWMGVFAHKNVLGHVMSVGVLAELYILTATKLRSFWQAVWHILVLCGCVALIALARSGTAMVLTAIYFLGTIAFLLLRRAHQYFGVGLAMLVVVATTVGLIFWAYPTSVLGLLGSDPTLTGRTQLWDIVLRLIWERPLLGWGYSAMWLPKDDLTLAISDAVGWTVPEAHNALLVVTLGLGIVGLAAVVTFIAVSIWRAIRCLLTGRYTLGVYSLVFFLAINLSGITESTLAQNQNIEWVVFNVLSICCGLEISRRRVSDKSESNYSPIFDMIGAHPS